MAAPDPYPAGGDSAGPANDASDEEQATPDGGGVGEEGETDQEGGDEDDEQEVLKNHIYLPPGFPREGKPKAGDKKKFIVDAEYVEDNEEGEHCWQIDQVDGVPIPPEDEESTEEDEQGDDAEADQSEGADESQLPAAAGTPPSTANDVTKMIMGGGQ